MWQRPRVRSGAVGWSVECAVFVLSCEPSLMVTEQVMKGQDRKSPHSRTLKASHPTVMGIGKPIKESEGI